METTIEQLCTIGGAAGGYEILVAAAAVGLEKAFRNPDYRLTEDDACAVLDELRRRALEDQEPYDASQFGFYITGNADMVDRRRRAAVRRASAGVLFNEICQLSGLGA